MESWIGGVHDVVPTFAATASEALTAAGAFGACSSTLTFSSGSVLVAIIALRSRSSLVLRLGGLPRFRFTGGCVGSSVGRTGAAVALSFFRIYVRFGGESSST